MTREQPASTVCTCTYKAQLRTWIHHDHTCDMCIDLTDINHSSRASQTGHRAGIFCLQKKSEKTKWIICAHHQPDRQRSTWPAVSRYPQKSRIYHLLSTCP